MSALSVRESNPCWPLFTNLKNIIETIPCRLPRQHLFRTPLLQSTSSSEVTTFYTYPEPTPMRKTARPRRTRTASAANGGTTDPRRNRPTARPDSGPNAAPPKPPERNRHSETDKPRHTPTQRTRDRREPPTPPPQGAAETGAGSAGQGREGPQTHPPSGSAGGGEREGPEVRTGARARSGEANPCARPQRTAPARKSPPARRGENASAASTTGRDAKPRTARSKEARGRG